MTNKIKVRIENPYNESVGRGVVIVLASESVRMLTISDVVRVAVPQIIKSLGTEIKTTIVLTPTVAMDIVHSIIENGVGIGDKIVPAVAIVVIDMHTSVNMLYPLLLFNVAKQCTMFAMDGYTTARQCVYHPLIPLYAMPDALPSPVRNALCCVHVPPSWRDISVHATSIEVCANPLALTSSMLNLSATPKVQKPPNIDIVMIPTNCPTQHLFERSTTWIATLDGVVKDYATQLMDNRVIDNTVDVLQYILGLTGAEQNTTDILLPNIITTSSPSYWSVWKPRLFKACAWLSGHIIAGLTIALMFFVTSTLALTIYVINVTWTNYRSHPTRARSKHPNVTHEDTVAVSNVLPTNQQTMISSDTQYF